MYLPTYLSLDIYNIINVKVLKICHLSHIFCN